MNSPFGKAPLYSKYKIQSYFLFYPLTPSNPISMNKRLLSIPFFTLVFAILFTFGASAQVKKDSKPRKTETKSEVKTPGGSDHATMQVAGDDEKKETARYKQTNETFVFVVFVNSNDGQSWPIWNSLPNDVPGLTITPLSKCPQSYLITTKNPAIALFKRAYGSYFQVFSEADLEMYGQSLSSFSELREEVKLLAAKLAH